MSGIKEPSENILSTDHYLMPMAILWGCASGERFGAHSDGHDDPDLPTVDCVNDADCWDADPGTIDLCEEDGTCQYLTIEDTDTGGNDTDPAGCVFDAEIDQDNPFMDPVDVSTTVSELVPTAPLSLGRLIKVSVREPRRLWIRPRQGEFDDLLLVLLKDCVNTAFNRVSWGKTIYSPELPEGLRRMDRAAGLDHSELTARSLWLNPGA